MPIPDLGNFKKQNKMSPFDLNAICKQKCMSSACICVLVIKDHPLNDLKIN